MANNVAVTAGSGTTMATDDVGGVHYPLVKLAVGTEDSAVRIGQLEDAAHASGDAGIMALAVRNDAGTAFAADGDYTPLMVDSAGRLYVNVAAGTLALSGEDHIGQTGGHTVVIKPTITVTAGAYSAGDVVGGEIALTSAMRTSGGSGVLTDLILTTADGEAPELHVLIFDSNPAHNVADNGTFAWGSGDHGRLLGDVHIAAADWYTLGGDGVCPKLGVNIGVKASGSADLYATFVAVGTPTFAATSDLTAAFKFLQD